MSVGREIPGDLKTCLSDPHSWKTASERENGGDRRTGLWAEEWTTEYESLRGGSRLRKCIWESKLKRVKWKVKGQNEENSKSVRGNNLSRGREREREGREGGGGGGSGGRYRTVKEAEAAEESVVPTCWLFAQRQKHTCSLLTRIMPCALLAHVRQHRQPAP